MKMLGIFRQFRDARASRAHCRDIPFAARRDRVERDARQAPERRERGDWHAALGVAAVRRTACPHETDAQRIAAVRRQHAPPYVDAFRRGMQIRAAIDLMRQQPDPQRHAHHCDGVIDRAEVVRFERDAIRHEPPDERMQGRAHREQRLAAVAPHAFRELRKVTHELDIVAEPEFAVHHDALAIERLPAPARPDTLHPRDDAVLAMLRAIQAAIEAQPAVAPRAAPQFEIREIDGETVLIRRFGQRHAVHRFGFGEARLLVEIHRDRAAHEAIAGMMQRGLAHDGFRRDVVVTQPEAMTQLPAQFDILRKTLQRV